MMKRFNDLHDHKAEPRRRWSDLPADAEQRPHGTVLSLEPNQEMDRLRTSVDELKASLDKATRRINRLLGERNQLTALLDKRDGQIQKLSRELGQYAHLQNRLSGKNGRTLSTDGVLLGSARRIAGYLKSTFQKISATDQTADMPATGTETDQSSPSLIVYQKGSVQQPIIAVLLLGLDEYDIARLLPVIKRDCASREMTPLCIIDNDSFELMRTRQLIFEYFPPANDRDRFDPDLRWDLYIQRRLAIIRRKWSPVRVVAFGEVATEMMQLWSSSPFEDEPIPGMAEMAST